MSEAKLRHWPVSGRSLRGRVILVHGFAEHSGRHSELAEFLAGLGFEVWAGDLRGHGHAPGQRGHIHRWHEYEEDVDSWVRAVPEPEVPLFLMGHSLGALVALDWTLSNPERVIALVLSNPIFEMAYRPAWWRIRLAEILSRLFPTFSQPAGIDADGLSTLGEVVEAYRRDPLVHGRATARFYVSFQKAARRLACAGPRVPCPTLVLFGEEDPIALAEGGRRFAATNPESIEYCSYPGAKHEVFHEATVVRERAVRAVATFLESRIP